MTTQIVDKQKTASPVAAPERFIPPLETGDRLTRAEFETRYEAMPQLKKAELIEGVVYMGSPVRIPHGYAHSMIMGWLTTYWAVTPHTLVLDNVTVRLDPDNEVQPDALLRREEAAGGRSKISADEYIEGPPELIVEIAASSASYDLHDKLHVYRRNGVQEYLVWRVYDQALDWFRLEAGRYVSLEPDEAGIIHSQVFPGLDLAAEALLQGDLAQVLQVVQAGLAGEKHQQFVQAMSQRREEAG